MADIEINITPDEYKEMALEDLGGIDKMLSDPLMTQVLGEEMVAGIRKVNDEKIAEINRLHPDE